jgi:hypothetical protein
MRERQGEWAYQLTADDVAELEAAVAAAELTGKPVEVGAAPPPPLLRCPLCCAALQALLRCRHCIHSALLVPLLLSRPSCLQATLGIPPAACSPGAPLLPSLTPLPSAPAPLLQDITLAEFQLPTFGPKLRAMLREVTHGRGFQLLRGVPVDRLTRKQSALAYWWVLVGWMVPGGCWQAGWLTGWLAAVVGESCPPDGC